MGDSGLGDFEFFNEVSYFKVGSFEGFFNEMSNFVVWAILEWAILEWAILEWAILEWAILSFLLRWAILQFGPFYILGDFGVGLFYHLTVSEA